MLKYKLGLPSNRGRIKPPKPRALSHSLSHPPRFQLVYFALSSVQAEYSPSTSAFHIRVVCAVIQIQISLSDELKSTLDEEFAVSCPKGISGIPQLSK